MNYKKSENKLIAAEARLTRLINKSSESLSATLKTEDKVESTLKTTEELSKFTDVLKLPLVVMGKMLGVGRHGKRYYTEEDLKWSVEYHKNRKFPIKYDHEHALKNEEGIKRVVVGPIIGQVDRIWYDALEQAVMYEGHINDETHARNVRDESITEVSASINSKVVDDPRVGIRAMEPEYKELSLVGEGRYGGNTIKAV